jgi:hypothetical protein
VLTLRAPARDTGETTRFACSPLFGRQYTGVVCAAGLAEREAPARWICVPRDGGHRAAIDRARSIGLLVLLARDRKGGKLW